MDIFTSVVCSYQMRSYLMSDSTTMCGLEIRIMLHYTLEIINLLRTLEIGLYVYCSRKLATSLIYSYQTISRMEYGKRR